MRKVGSTTDTADSNGEYTNGNVANGVPPTIINAEMLNTFQRELVNVVEGSGQKLDSDDFFQLFKAITKIVNDSTSKDIDRIYPVGIVTWFAQNKDPNKLFYGTTWKYVGENKTIRLAGMDGKDVMTTGGSDSVKLSIDNLPVHGHSFVGKTSQFDYGTKTTDRQGTHDHKGGMGAPGAKWGDYISGSDHDSNYGSNKTDSNGEHSHDTYIGPHGHEFSGETDNTGKGSELSIVNSYIKLMGWYRIE